jgi:CRP-like cAMP-binding protein
MLITKQDIENLSTFQIFNQSAWFVEVVRLGDGSTFGELALLNSKPRAATINCVVDSTFGVLNKHDYKKIIEKVQRRENEKKLKFFQCVPMI